MYLNAGIVCRCGMFMTSKDIRECIKSIKLKNTEGYDGIPQRVLVDGLKQLLAPLTHLFELIYRNKVIPEQWVVLKIVQL